MEMREDGCEIVFYSVLLSPNVLMIFQRGIFGEVHDK